MNDPVNYVDLWGLQAGILDLVDDLLPVIVVLGPVGVKVAVVVAAVVVVVVVADAIIDAVTNDDPPAEDEDIGEEEPLDPGAKEDQNVKVPKIDDLGDINFSNNFPPDPDLPTKLAAAAGAALGVASETEFLRNPPEVPNKPWDWKDNEVEMTNNDPDKTPTDSKKGD